MAIVTVFHFVPYDAPGRRGARAICGQWVDRYREFSREPNCPGCQRILAARRQDDSRSVEDAFGHDHGGPPVKSTLLNTLEGYRQKGAR